MELSYEEIKKILPHRYPFLMIDKIIDLKEGEYAKGIKCVSGNEEFFQGHFPDYAVMPGVLQIEAVAQVGAVSILLGEDEKKKVFFGGIKNARFYKQIVPGDKLEIECSIRKRRGNIGFGEGRIYCDGEKVLICEISFAIV
ncbi:MAG: 3-hydroxyacyl-ACP dehydratase FabZ [Tissierellia bacterium]|nr:3-hydroxyacyl-ACP dehydratase FabZ [Tissierellia bacterium]